MKVVAATVVGLALLDSLRSREALEEWRRTLLRGRLPDATTDWPKPPLLHQAISNVLIELQLPRFVARHPETIDTVLLCLMRIATHFEERTGKIGEEEEEEVDDEDEEAYDTEQEDDPNDTESALPIDDDDDNQLVLLAEELASGIVNEFGDAITGTQHLDQLFFGVSHSFGLDDGVWKHSGWKLIPQLQREITRHPQLRQLLRRLGKRPSAVSQSRRNRFRQRKPSGSGSMSAVLDPVARTHTDGLTYSNRLAEMVASEAVLLRGSPRLRRLFRARFAESKLLSYQRMGWYDDLSKSITQQHIRLPSAPGGPLVVCLDTSHSMSGRREVLSKAIVLASVSTFDSCRIIAFGTANNVVEFDSIDTGIQHLLDFLSSSFGGGTDVTGALRYAISDLVDDGVSSDILLVTDGEIPVVDDPELLQKVMNHQIHGLLVGDNPESPNLEAICSETHNFFVGGGPLFATLGRPSDAQAIGWARTRLPKQPMLLRARRRRFEEDDDDVWDRLDEDSSPSVRIVQEPVVDQFNQLVESALEQIQSHVAGQEQPAPELEECGKFHDQLREAVARVSENLVERDTESRLVVLGMLAGEHILFIGLPGTAKSQLGRRLSQLCGGPFFQRLLTKFTTPEEIFGPLSLSALENDEYRRVTKGFLPQASIAFLDEIFKANSAILNTLLTILNERQFDNGQVRETCPIRCVIAASNELPEDSGELEALYDRFLLRKEVAPVSDKGLVNLLRMNSTSNAKCDSQQSAVDNECQLIFTDGLDAVIGELSKAAESVTMSDDICYLLRDLRIFLRDELDQNLSDRRLVKASRLLKLSAASHGRSRVDLIDCLLLQHVAWHTPDQQNAIKDWLWDQLRYPAGDQVSSRVLLNSLRQESTTIVRKTNGDVTGGSGGRPNDIALIGSLRSEAFKIQQILAQRAQNVARHVGLLEDAPDHLWLDPEEAQSAQQLLVPNGNVALKRTEDLLNRARSLVVALSDDPPATLTNQVRLRVLEQLWDYDDVNVFNEDELTMSMKQAKAKFDSETFRNWKRARKRAQ